MNVSNKYKDPEYFCNLPGNIKLKSLSIFHHNVCFLSKNFDQLHVLWTEIDIDFDFIGTTESFISKTNFSPTNVVLANYAIQQTPTESNAGGALLYINRKHSYKLRKYLKLYKPRKIESVFVFELNPLSNRFTYRKNHFSGLIQRRIDYIFILNSLQKSIQNIDVLPSFCSDHSRILFSYKNESCLEFGKNLWKFNSSLTKDETYVTKMKEHIKDTKDVIDKGFSDSSQTKWEFLKYEMRKFTISYSKVKAKNSREKRAHLENKLKVLEQNLTSEQFKREYDVCKQELNTIYDEIGTGIKIRSRSN